jgi:site-specific recombinase XerD
MSHWIVFRIIGNMFAIWEPWITPYTFRHTYARTLFRKGVKINVVSRFLGHKDVATTYDIYIHMFPQGMENAAEVVGKTLMGGQDRAQQPHSG